MDREPNFTFEGINVFFADMFAEDTTDRYYIRRGRKGKQWYAYVLDDDEPISKDRPVYQSPHWHPVRYDLDMEKQYQEWLLECAIEEKICQN